MPLVSVVIPTHNSASYLKASVESVFVQTLADIEIILIDDNSSDTTRDILESFRDPRVKLIFLKESRGPSGARNTGILAAKGHYVAFLDSDDIWLPAKIEKQILLFRNPLEVGLVYSDCFLIDQDGRRIEQGRNRIFQYSQPKKGNAFLSLLCSNFIATSSAVVKRVVFKKIGMFDERYFVAQDYDFFLRVSKYYAVDYLDEPLVKYRWKVGISRSSRETALREPVEIIRNHSLYQKLPYWYRILVSRTLMDYYKELGYFYLEKGRPRDAMKSFLRAFLRFPFHPKIFFGLLRCVLSAKGNFQYLFS